MHQRLPISWTPTRISLAGSLLLALFFVYLAWSGWQQQQVQWQSQLQAQSDLQRVALLQSHHNLRQQALRAAQGLASDPDSLRLIRRIALLAERYGLDDPQLLLLRAQLQQDLQEYWRILHEGGAHQLHIHLAPGVISLLRMHRPESWGDGLQQVRPLLAEVQASGNPASGLELGRFDSGIRGAVAIRASDDPDGPVIASVEVGFGMLPGLHMLDNTLDAGLAMLLNTRLMDEVLWQAPPRALHDTLGGIWLLDDHSRPELRDWLAQVQLDARQTTSGPLVVGRDNQRFLLTAISLRDRAGELDPQREDAALIIAWQNVSGSWQAMRENQWQGLLKWLLALLAALGVLLLLLRALQHSLRRQMDARFALQQQLQEHSQRLDKLGRHLPGVIYQYQLDPAGHSWFPWASHAIEDIYGVTAAEAAIDAAPVFERILTEDRARVEAAIRLSAEQLSTWHEEYRVLHPQRGELWLSGAASPERLEDGSIIWHGHIADITERKRMELALADQRQRLAQIIQATRAGTWEVDLRSGAVQINARWAEIIGYRPEELTPFSLERWSALAQPEERDQGIRLLQRHLDGLQDYHESRYRLRHRDGHWVWVEDRGQITRRNSRGQPICLSGTTSDITEAYKAEQAKARFISTVSHELRTPLTAINGAIGLLAGGALGRFEPAVENLLNIARDNSQSLILLINDLLDIDRLQAGRLQLELRAQPLQPLLQQALRSNQSYADQFKVSLQASDAGDLAVVTDTQRFAQIMANLLSNAAKFSHPGDQVQVTSTAAERPGFVRISVTDQGIGIDPAFMPKLFDSFSQADASDRRQRGGSGLGLAICRALVEQMGGRIGCESQPGQGSCFWFELPVAE